VSEFRSGTQNVSREDLLSRIADVHPLQRRTVLVAIDGRGASGKTTLARFIAESRADVTVVHTDDFFLDPGWDWSRMREQVLEPIVHDQPGRYQRFDWDSRRLAGWHDVPVGGVMVVEGVSSTRSELADLWDLKIWVECPRKERLKRALERDGEAMMPTWLNVWEIQEDRYVLDESPARRADLVIDGRSRA
jgi:uridine kinase